MNAEKTFVSAGPRVRGAAAYPLLPQRSCEIELRIAWRYGSRAVDVAPAGDIGPVDARPPTLTAAALRRYAPRSSGTEMLGAWPIGCQEIL